MSRGIARKLKGVLDNVNREIEMNAVGKYGAGLSNEGYAGGYAQAIRDVLAFQRGHYVPTTRTYWKNIEL